MKLLIILFWLISVSVSAQTVYVKRVVDGDTFKDSADLSYRLIGINAPERKDDGGPEAKRFLESAIGHKYIRVVTDSKYDTTDFYRRKLCYVFVDGTDINKLMIQTGHAKAYTKYPFSKTQEYLDAEKGITDKPPNVQAKPQVSNTEKESFISKNIGNAVLLVLTIILMAIAAYYYRK